MLLKSGAREECPNYMLPRSIYNKFSTLTLTQTAKPLLSEALPETDEA